MALGRRLEKVMRASGLRQERPTGNNVAMLERSSTKALLIDTGELLYGQRGFGGISLREIAAMAGQRNCNAVQYHFKNKFGFVSAILADRVWRLDALRAQRFAELGARVPDGAYLARDLLAIIWLPDLSIIGPDKTHTYIRFSLQYYLQPDVGAHPFYTRDPETGRGSSTEEGKRSSLFHANLLLRGHFAHISEETFTERLRMLSMLYQCSVVEHDHEHALGSGKKRRAYDVDPIIDMALGALSAPT
jgi:AcrR family transcriptional regulator